jgi:fermentation-respiration switch protein FrsA (DUF1100 family)
MAALGLLIGVSVVFVLLWVVQRRLIYFPDSASPAIAAMPQGWEEITYETSDGLLLTGWLRPPQPDHSMVIVFNGNGGNRMDRISLGSGLAEAGHGVLLTDYRGYGGNPGHPSESGLAIDARAAARYVREGYSDHPVVYFGESLGAAVAIELASTEPPAALILRSPFTSLVAAARTHYPWIPVSLLLKDRYPSDELIGSIDVPTLVVFGGADSIVPPSQSRAIYDAAPGPKGLVVIEGADHNDAVLTSGRRVIAEAQAHIEDAIRQ